jgi:glycerophosphoryl diester phosphodiesterase
MGMIEQLPRPALFAHRGASRYAPENTLAAFEIAIKQQADAIELDVKMTADGHVVVIHDQTVDRTTDGTGKVADKRLVEIKQLDAGVNYDAQFTGEMVPTLEEVLLKMAKRIPINIELTNYASLFNNLPEKVATIVRECSMEDFILFSSFNPIALLKIKKILPEVPIGLLCLPGKNGAIPRSRWVNRLSHEAIHPDYKDITRRLIRAAHKHNKRVHAYTINHVSNIQNMFDIGVDGIFTDDPLLAKQVLNQQQGIIPTNPEPINPIQK